jgi:hypothetical protein
VTTVVTPPPHAPLWVADKISGLEMLVLTNNRISELKVGDAMQAGMGGSSRRCRCLIAPRCSRQPVLSCPAAWPTACLPLPPAGPGPLGQPAQAAHAQPHGQPRGNQKGVQVMAGAGPLALPTPRPGNRCPASQSALGAAASRPSAQCSTLLP